MHTLTTIISVVGGIATLICLVVAIIAKPPTDTTIVSVAVVEVLVMVLVLWSLFSLATGSQPRAQTWELILYLAGIAAVPIAAAYWALLEKTRWSNFVLAVACLTVVVMNVRIDQLWFGAGG